MIFETIKGRRSVRTFDGTGISDEHREMIQTYIGTIKNPFDIPVRFVLLGAEKYGLSSQVLKGDKLYAAGVVKKGPYADVAFGYSFEKLVLYAWSLGIGTVWIGGTMPREKFEKAAGLSDGEMMPCITPLGYPAPKLSFKETVMRKAIGADARIGAEKFFFSESFGTPLPEADKKALADLIDAVRWAPSAVNKQPWRIVKSGQAFHFYEKKNKGFVSDSTGDIQKIDVGIALCHFAAGLEELDRNPEVTVQDPGLPVPADTEYIATVTMR